MLRSTESLQRERRSLPLILSRSLIVPLRTLSGRHHDVGCLARRNTYLYGVRLPSWTQPACETIRCPCSISDHDWQALPKACISLKPTAMLDSVHRTSLKRLSTCSSTTNGFRDLKVTVEEKTRLSWLVPMPGHGVRYL